VEAATFSVTGEPDVHVADRGAAVAIAFEAEAVVAVGGGSVIDAAKAIAALATSGGSAIDYLEDLPSGGGRSLEAAPLPVVAVPTTAGTGSEVTRNAVLRVPEWRLKRSMRDDRMLPAVAVVDPELAAFAPPEVAVPAALDALTHLIEAYVSRGAQPTTDLLALEGARRAVRALATMAANGAAGSAKDGWDDLALASLWGGITLANAGLGAVHGLAAPLGGRCAIPHGAACAALLAPTMRANIEALRARAPEAPALARYGELASALVGSADTARLVESIDGLRARLGARPLASYGVDAGDLSPVIGGARGGSMKNNPIVLTDGELDTVLRAALV
ncbi:MAG: iron-containing alcohol dehydrogenase, partial [Polyangiaceae bacterium]|nr:iron-containing alcohol dehydrogenase [Polyangiaceae bacterium]